MTQFLLALAVFLLLHSVPAMPVLRNGLVARLGRRPYLIVYSLVSLLTLGWVFHAAFKLDYVELWTPAAWQAWVPIILSPLGFFFLVAGLVSPNPGSITLRRGDLAPGAIITVTRHPVLWGFTLWAGSHLIPNGDLRSVILFGALGLFAVGGMFTTERRAKRRLGERWAGFAATTSIIPFAAILGGRTSLRIDTAMLAALIVAALLSTWLLLGGHAVLFGADPLALATA